MSDTYVHTDLELLDILPMFAKGGKLNILVCVGLFDVDPVGASFNDLLAYTGLSRPTVHLAVKFLVSNGFIAERDGYFHPLKFVRFESNSKKRIFSRVSTNVRTENQSSTDNTSSSTYGEKNFQQGEIPMTTFDDQIEELDKPKSKWILPQTNLSRYLAAQKIGRWKHSWKGFTTKKEQGEWDVVESLYEPATIRQKIDYFVSLGIPPKFICSRIITALRENVKPNKEPERPHVDNRPTARPKEDMPAPAFGFQKT